MGLIERRGGVAQHPSEKVRGYVGYCWRLHSAVQAHGAAMDGCVLVTWDRYVTRFMDAPKDALAGQLPCYSADGNAGELSGYLTRRIDAPALDFAEAFEQGHYQQDGSFVRHIGRRVLDPKQTPLEQIDNQRLAFARERVTSALFGEQDVFLKRVIIRDGPPNPSL